MERKRVQVLQLGMAELGFPTFPVSSCAPPWCSGSRFSVSLHSTPPPAKASNRGFQNGDGSLSPSSLARWAGERVHFAATLVNKLECCLTILEIPQLAGKLPQPFLLTLGSLAWSHRETDSAWGRGRVRSVGQVVFMLSFALPLTHW